MDFKQKQIEKLRILILEKMKKEQRVVESFIQNELEVQNGKAA